MLSDECKSLVYPTVEHFKQNYYQKVFYINRMYNLENWYANNGLYTYYITYTEDVLSTGNVNSKDNKADYITIVRSSSGDKLNICSYIGRKIYNNRSVVKNGVSVKINWLDMYMDYTIANVSIKNDTSNTICLDTKESVQSTYLYGASNVKYTGLLNEIAGEQLIVRRSMTNNINIKFNRMYNPERELIGLAFADVVMNYEEYISGMSDKNSMEINLTI